MTTELEYRIRVTPTKDEWEKRVAGLDSGALHTEVKYLNRGDFAYIPQTPIFRGAKGFVKRINRKSVTIEVSWSGQRGHDIVLLEQTFPKALVTAYYKQKKQKLNPS